MAGFGDFKSSEVAPSESYELLPPGVYTAMLTESDLKTSNAGGQYFSLCFQITDEDFSGRKVWDNITWKHDNEKAVNIGRAKMSSLCLAAGVENPEDSEELHDRPIMIKLGIKKGKDGYEDSNNIKEYSATETGIGSKPWDN